MNSDNFSLLAESKQDNSNKNSDLIGEKSDKLVRLIMYQQLAKEQTTPNKE